jgi:hypothetical protein
MVMTIDVSTLGVYSRYWRSVTNVCHTVTQGLHIVAIKDKSRGTGASVFTDARMKAQLNNNMLVAIKHLRRKSFGSLE